MTIIENTCTLPGLQKRLTVDYNNTLVCDWYFPFNSIICSKHGFILNLSPQERSWRKGVHWFDFHLQTSPTQLQRVLAFNAPAHQQIQNFQDTKTPVLLKNLVIKQDKFVNNLENLLQQVS